MSKQSFLSPGFHFHAVPPVSPSLLIFPLCARPGHLYQSVRPVSKGKVSTVEGRGHSCYSCHAWWFSGAGCRIFQKQLCASGADGEPDLKEFLSLSKPHLSLHRHAWLGAQTYSNSHSTRNIRSPLTAALPFSPAPNISLWLSVEASITPDDIGSFSSPCTFQPTKMRERGEQLLFRLCDYIITEQQTCIQYIKRNLSLAYFYVMVAKYRCVFAG